MVVASQLLHQDLCCEDIPTRHRELLGAGLDAGIHNCASGVSEFGAVVAGLQTEFSQRVRRRSHHEAGAVQEVHEVGIVVHAVKNEVVLSALWPLATKSPVPLPRVFPNGGATPAVSCAMYTQLRPLRVCY